LRVVDAFHASTLSIYLLTSPSNSCSPSSYSFIFSQEEPTLTTNINTYTTWHTTIINKYPFGTSYEPSIRAELVLTTALKDIPSSVLLLTQAQQVIQAVTRLHPHHQEHFHGEDKEDSGEEDVVSDLAPTPTAVVEDVEDVTTVDVINQARDLDLDPAQHPQVVSAQKVRLEMDHPETSDANAMGPEALADIEADTEEDGDIMDAEDHHNSVVQEAQEVWEGLI